MKYGISVVDSDCRTHVYNPFNYESLAELMEAMEDDGFTVALESIGVYTLRCTLVLPPMGLSISTFAPRWRLVSRMPNPVREYRIRPEFFELVTAARIIGFDTGISSKIWLMAAATIVGADIEGIDCASVLRMLRSFTQEADNE